MPSELAPWITTTIFILGVLYLDRSIRSLRGELRDFRDSMDQQFRNFRDHMDRQIGALPRPPGPDRR